MPGDNEARDTMFHVRMTTAEREMLEQLAEEDGLSASDIVRVLIRRAFREKWPPKDKPQRGGK
jgi:hypothetical protein